MQTSVISLLAFCSVTACIVSDKADTKGPDSTVAVAPAPTTSTPDTAVIPTAPLPPTAPAENTWTVSSAGYGPVRAGMTVAELRSAFGDSLVIPGDLGECGYIHPRNSPLGVFFMIENGKLARVEGRSNTSIKTAAGAGVGDTEDRIKSLYPGQVTVQPHKYTDGHYLVVKPTGSPANERIIFETDGKRVTQFRSGRTPAVEYVESCS